MKQQHKLKIGITSSGTEQVKIIEEAQKISCDGKDLFDSYQVTFNIFEQSCFEILKHLLTQGKTIIIKEALANGRIFRNANFPEHQLIYEFLEQLSEKYSVGIDAIALRFIIDNLEPNIILSGASNSNQLKENLKTLNFELDENELSKLKSFAVSPQNYWKERNNLKWN